MIINEYFPPLRTRVKSTHHGLASDLALLLLGEFVHPLLLLLLLLQHPLSRLALLLALLPLRPSTWKHNVRFANYLIFSVFRIRDILVRILIRGSLPLINISGSESGFGSCSFCQWSLRCQQKIKLYYIFLLITFWRCIYIILQRWKVIKHLNLHNWFVAAALRHGEGPVYLYLSICHTHGV